VNDYIRIALQADPVGMVAGFQAAEGAMAKFNSAFQSSMTLINTGKSLWANFVGSIKSFGQKMMASGAGGAAYFVGAIKSAMDYQVQLKNVQALTKESNASISMASDEIMNMSRTMPQSGTELASGLYDIASSGFQGADAMKILNASATSASAGMTTAAVSSKAIVAVLNAYGKSANEAGDISDILFQTVNMGVLTFEEAASGLGTWVGMAAQAGVAAEEASSAIAVMTLSGIGADSAATYLSRMMQETLDPTDAMTAAVQALGYENAKAMLDAEGLGQMFLTLNDSVGGDVVAFNSLFGSIQATRGAMAIIANEGQTWARVSGEITDKNARAGAAQKAFAVQSEGLAVKMKVFWNNVKAIAIEIGMMFLGPIGMIFDFGSAVLSVLQSLPKGMMKVAGAIGAVVTVLLLAGGALLTFAAGAIAAKLALFAMSAAVAILQGTTLFGPMITAILSVTQYVLALTKSFTLMGIAKAFAFNTGPLAGATTAATTAATTSAASGGLGAAVAGAGAKMSAALSSAMVTALPVALVAGFALSIKHIADEANKAREAGRKMGEEFKESLSTATFNDVTSSLVATRKEIESIAQELVDMKGDPQNLIRGGNPKWLSALNPFDGADELVYAKKQAYFESLAETEREMYKKKDQFAQVVGAMGSVKRGERFRSPSDIGMKANDPNGDAVAAAGNTAQMSAYKTDLAPTNPRAFDALQMYYDKALGTTDSMKSDLGTGLADLAEISGKGVEEITYEFGKIAEVEGINLDDLLEPGTAGEAMARQLMATYDATQNLSPAATETALSFAAMGKEADDATGNLELLQTALESVLSTAFIEESANDALQTLVNDTMKAVDEIKTNGNLADAMDLNSYSEDAIALRAQMRDLMGGLVAQTTAWAQAQESVTATDINAHLQAQIDQIKAYGAEMGLSQELIDHYVKSLQDTVTSGIITATFNVDTNAAEASLSGFLTKMGATPDQQETVMEVYTTEGEAALQGYLASIGIVDQQDVLTTVTFLSDAASGKLNDYLTSLNMVADKATISTIVSLSVGGDQAAIDAFMGKNNITQDQFNQVVNLTGDADSMARLEALKRAGAEADGQTYTPTVDVDTANAMSAIDQVNAALKALTTPRTIIITPKLPDGYKPPSIDAPVAGRAVGPQTKPYPPKKEELHGSIHLSSFADGGLPNNAVIKPPQKGMGLVQWAEPQTGGEAFIPMSPAKRIRSELILQEVAKQFGGRYVKFEEGGLRSRFRSGVLSSDKKEEAAKKEKAAKEEKASKDKAAEAAAPDVKQMRANTDAAHEFFYKSGLMPASQYLANIEAGKSELEAFTSEWWAASQKVLDFQKSLAEEGNAAIDFYREQGVTGDQEYFANLTERLNRERTYSTEWWGIQSKIASEKKKVLKDTQANEDALYNLGNQGTDKKMKQLKDRLALEKAGGTESLNLQKQIQDLEMAQIQRMNRFGNMTDGAYVEWLKGQIAQTEIYSDRWEKLTSEIASVAGTAFDKGSGGFFEQFGKSQYVNANSAMRWLQNEINQANTWAGLMKELKATGAYGEGVVNRLQSMGPDSVGLVRALIGAAGNGSSASFNSLFSQANSLGRNELTTANQSAANMLPVGYVQPANAVRTTNLGSNTGTTINITMPNATIMNRSDADRFGDRVAFAINSGGF
jgi:TP901 family phage tail tape measure protein